MVPPVETLRLLAHRLVRKDSPYVTFSAAGQGFIATIEASETLKARARAIRDELAQVVATALTDSTGRDAHDPQARLAASLLLATWSTALIEAHRHFRQHGDTQLAKTCFLSLVDQGHVGLKAALAGTPYV